MYVSNVTEKVSDAEYENMHLLYDTLDAAARVSNSTMFVIDFSQNKLVYRTEKLLFADDACIKDVQRENANPYWSLMTTEDMNVMLETRKAYLNLIDGFTVEQRLRHFFIMDYSIVLNNRRFVITQKFTPLKLRPDGKLWLGLFFITTSPNTACANIFVFGECFRYIYDSTEKRFILYNGGNILTSIEKSILLRASKGLTTQQIADELCLSINTIKTHKFRLFGKLHVCSMNEALRVAVNYGLY